LPADVHDLAGSDWLLNSPASSRKVSPPISAHRHRNGRARVGKSSNSSVGLALSRPPSQYGAGIQCDLRFLADRRRLLNPENTARPPELVALVAAYAKAQGMYRVKTTPDPMFTDIPS
jgi:hypothetical protein